MKRDMELARRILLAVEEAPCDSGGWVDRAIPDASEKQVAYHVMLLHQAGLVEATDLSTMRNREWKPKWLTWEGHEFLEASRNETAWKRTLATVGDKGGGAIFEVVRALLIDAAKKAVLSQVIGPLPDQRLQRAGATTKEGTHSICASACDAQPSQPAGRLWGPRPQLKRVSLGVPCTQPRC
jgi:hypothetical protein